MKNKANAGEISVKTCGMKWYNFLIYFGLFAFAILNGLSGIILCIENLGGLVSTFFSSLLGDRSNLIQNVMDAFYGLTTKPMNAFYGLNCIALAVWTLYVRSALNLQKKAASKMLLILHIWIAVSYALLTTLPWIYTIALFGFSDFTEIFSIIDLLLCIFVCAFNIIMAIINRTYFKKRQDLFRY